MNSLTGPFNLRRFLGCLALGVLVLVGCLYVQVAHADHSNSTFQVIRPTDEEHKLLPKTCRVCHREGELHFMLVTAPNEEGLVEAEERLFLSRSQVKAAKVNANAHSKIVCLFCHMTQPERDDDPATMAFRTPSSTPVGRDDVVQLCKLCHPKVGDTHRRVVSSDKSGSDLALAGVTEKGAKARCSNCHEMHRPKVGPAAVGEGFMEFAEKSINLFPHGNRAGCRACHPEQLDETATDAVFLTDDSNARCERCHPESHAKVHRVGVGSTDKTFPMDFLDFPLNKDGTMHCSTCHDEPCKEPISSSNEAFLREGPYPSPTEFCYRCHPRSGEGSLSPHKQVDEKGNVTQSSCVFCHLDVDSDPEDLAYLHSPIELCMNCHDTPAHPAVNHLVELSESFALRLADYSKRHGVYMPLDEHGQIVCTTCHNPHGKGVLSGKYALGAGEDKKWRVPSFAELCTPCHTRYD